MTLLMKHADRSNLDGLSQFGVGSAPTSVPVEVYQAQGRYVVRVDIPGLDPDIDLSVLVENDVLTIHAATHFEKSGGCRVDGRSDGFTRAFRLPGGCTSDDVSARYDKGVLEVSVPMTDQPSQPHHIAITHGR